MLYEYFKQVPNVPLKANLEGIKCDPNCLHSKKVITSSHSEVNHGMNLIFFY